MFEAILENAVRICDARAGGICRWDGHALHHVAVKSLEPAFAELLRRTPIHPNPKTNFGRMLVTKKAVHVPDLAAQPAYIEQREPGIVAAVEIGRLRTVLYVPMLREGELVGAITLGSGDARPSPTSRSNWSRTSPRKPSSPSRTRGCSTNCGNRWSSRPPRQRCCKLSVALPASLIPFFAQFSQTPRGL